MIGLSLRPLAAALGTSDRMVLYHFGSKDELVADVLRCSNDRAVAQVAALPPSGGIAAAVTDLWIAVQSPPADRCTRIYIQAAALGLLGREPYSSVVREANCVWLAALVRHLVASGVDRSRAGRAAQLVDAAFMGFQLDQSLENDSSSRDRAVTDLGATLAALTDR